MSAREGVYDLALTILGVVVGGTILLLLNDGFSRVPDIENLLFPPVRFAPVTETFRDKQRFCFRLDGHKLQTADPVKFEFYLETRMSPRIAASAYVTDADWQRLTHRRPVSHAKGESWSTHYCSELPATVADFQPLRVSGFARYHRHPIYDTRTDISAFVVPPLAGTDP